MRQETSSSPNHIVLTALFLFAFLPVIACQSAPQESESQGESAERMTEESPSADDNSTVQNEEQQAQDRQQEQNQASSEGESEESASAESESGDESMANQVQNLEEEVSEQERRNRQLAQKKFQSAQQLYQRGEHEKAYEDVNSALEANPNHLPAIRLRNELASLLGYEDESRRGQELENRMDAIIEQQKKFIRNRINRVRELRDQQEFDRAKEILRNLEIRIQAADWLEVQEFEEMSRQVENLREEVELAARRHQKKVEQRLVEESESQALEEERQRMLEELRTVSRLMERGNIYMEQHEFEEAKRMANLVLAEYPDYEAARELRRAANQAVQAKWEDEHLQRTLEEWKNFQSRMTELRIPNQDTYEFPSQEYWREVSQRVNRLGPVADLEDEEVVDVLSIERKLETEEVNLDFVDANLEEMLDKISSKANLNTVIRPEVRDRAREKHSAVVNSSLTLKNALGLITDKFNVDYTLRRGAIEIVENNSVDAYNRGPQAYVYDISDITAPLRDFESRDLGQAGEAQLSGERGEMNFGSSITGGAERGENPYEQEEAENHVGLSQDSLVNMIRQNIEPDSWNHPDYNIRAHDSGHLFVNHTPSVQAQIEDTLNDVRSHAGAMVSIEARFLTLREEDLEEFGVELRELEGAPAIPGRDQYRGDQSTGVFAQRQNLPSRGTAWDFRFGTQYNIYDNLAALRQSQTIGSLVNSPPMGGLGMTLEVLDGWNYNVALRALSQTRDATILDSTSMTVYNTQRAHIAIAQEESYIADYDTQIAQESQAFDPIIDTIFSGLVLDVRPIISHDRKYVTLELRPAIAESTVTNFPFTTAFGAPVEIQLPTVDLRRAQSTVRIPDRGGVLLGGLKRSEDNKLEKKVPILGDIPLLGSIFSRQIDQQASRELMILVNVEIIDTSERERQAFGESLAPSASSDGSGSNGSGSGAGN